MKAKSHQARIHELENGIVTMKIDGRSASPAASSNNLRPRNSSAGSIYSLKTGLNSPLSVVATNFM